MSLRVVLLGPPASGKGTQGRRLARDAGLAYFSTGKQLRRELDAETELGEQARPFLDAGRYVPDEIVLRLAIDWLQGVDGGWVLDGFPRTGPQARSLDAHLRPDEAALEAVLLEVDADELERRVGERRECGNCSWTGTRREAAATAGLCPACGGKLASRPDDELKNFRSRHRTFAELTLPVADYYDKSGRLRRVAGAGTPDEVYARVWSALCLA